MIVTPLPVVLLVRSTKAIKTHVLPMPLSNPTAVRLIFASVPGVVILVSAIVLAMLTILVMVVIVGQRVSGNWCEYGSNQQKRTQGLADTKHDSHSSFDSRWRFLTPRRHESCVVSNCVILATDTFRDASSRRTRPISLLNTLE
jgi:hypothetical protein